MDYRFDLSDYTIGDAFAVTVAAKENDVMAILQIANRFIPINLLALPMTELPIVLQCFYQALVTPVTPDPIDALIRKALEDTHE